MEYGNAFSELNDPIDQKERFEKQVAAKRAAEPNTNAQVDYDYVTALEYGLAPTGGLGFGNGPFGHAAHRQRLHSRCAAVPHDETYRLNKSI